MAEVKVSEAIASMMWTACAGGEPVELALFRDWLEAYHLARVQEELPEHFIATGRFVMPPDAWPRFYEEVCGGPPRKGREGASAVPPGDPPEEPPADPSPLEGFEPVEAKKPGPWAVKKLRILDRLEAAMKQGVTRGQIAEASGGKLGLQNVMDFVERKQKKVAEWDALSAALKKLEGGAANAAEPISSPGA